jgi:hypothetical protein
MGYDSDASIAQGEVGKVGVAIDSIDDMRRLFQGIPLDKVSTSMTINAPASVLLLLYQLVAEEQGVTGAQLNGTAQNDILKEYIARGTYIFPPKPSLRLVADTFAYCRAEIPKWNTISISGYTWPRPARRRAGDRVHAGQRHRVRARGGRRRAGRRRLRAPAVLLLRRAHHAARGDREVPRRAADAGPGSCATSSARRIRSR